MSGTAISIIVVAVILVIWLLGQSIRTVRPTSRGLIERFAETLPLNWGPIGGLSG